jgi:hypothetical protein
LFGSLTRPRGPVSTSRACLQCGVVAQRPDATICRRCGLELGAPPRSEGALAACPVCYQTTDDDGLIDSSAIPGRRLDMVAHLAEHDRFPVGDDDYLEGLRRGDRIRLGRWEAPFDLVRRYLVTGVVDAGPRRATQHGAIVTAMAQLARWGSGNVPTIGDQAEWAAARSAVTELMERYHRRRA